MPPPPPVHLLRPPSRASVDRTFPGAVHPNDRRVFTLQACPKCQCRPLTVALRSHGDPRTNKYEGYYQVCAGSPPISSNMVVTCNGFYWRDDLTYRVAPPVSVADVISGPPPWLLRLPRSGPYGNLHQLFMAKSDPTVGALPPPGPTYALCDGPECLRKPASARASTDCSTNCCLTCCRKVLGPLQLSCFLTSHRELGDTWSSGLSNRRRAPSIPQALPSQPGLPVQRRQTTAPIIPSGSGADYARYIPLEAATALSQGGNAYDRRKQAATNRAEREAQRNKLTLLLWFADDQPPKAMLIQNGPVDSFHLSEHAEVVSQLTRIPMQSLYTASFGYWSDSLRTWVDTFERIPVPAKRYIFARLDGIQTCVDLHQHIAVPKTPSKRQRSPEQYRTVTPASVQAQLPLPTPSPSPTKRRRIVHDDSGPSYPPPSSSPSSVHDLTVETTPQVASNRMSQADFDAYLDAYRPQSPSPAYTPLQTGQEHENERRIPAVRPTNFSSIDAIRDWLQTAPRSKRATFPFLYTSDNCLLYGAMATLSNAAPLNSDPAKASHILGRTVKQQTLSENKKIWLNLSPTIKKHALQVGPAAGLWTDHRAART